MKTRIELQNKRELRELSKSRYATVLEYLRVLRALGLEITDDNKGIAHTGYAERVINQTYESNGTDMMLESLHYVKKGNDRHVNLSGLAEAILDNAGLKHTWSVDKWREMLMELQDSMKAVAKGVIDESWGADLENSLEVIRKQSAILDAEVSEVCEELDDLYLELLQTKDLFEHQIEETVWNSVVDPKLVEYVGEVLEEINTSVDVLEVQTGDKLIALHLESGSEGDIKLAQQLLVQGNNYTVRAIIRKPSISNSRVHLEEVPGVWFSLVHFDKVEIGEELV